MDASFISKINDQCHRVSSQSLKQYLGYVTIDSEPQPAAWGSIIEPWQKELVRPIIPAIEAMAGLRSDYTGPTSFWFGLPKGHDKTGLIGRLANWCAGFSRNRISGAAAASTRDQAALLLKSATAELQLNPWIPVQSQQYLLRGTADGMGGEIKILASEAGAISGRKDDLIICDELTFWQGQDLWDSLYASAFKRSRQIFIVITNAGLRDTWQWQLREHARTDPSWHFYESPHGQMLASWMTREKVNKVREGLSPGFARRVIDNEWIDATENPLLTREMIMACQSDCLWTSEHFADESYRPQLYLGVDFGRTKNRTVIWVWEECPPLSRENRRKILTRDIRVLHNVPFAEQESIIRGYLNLKWPGGKPRVLKCKMDKGAQGWTTCENLERDFPHVCEGEHLSGGYRGAIAAKLKEAFAQLTVQVPDNAEMTADLQRVGQVETANGKPSLRVDESADGLHADYFWAAALGIDAIPGSVKSQRTCLPRGVLSPYHDFIRNGSRTPGPQMFPVNWS